MVSTNFDYVNAAPQPQRSRKPKSAGRLSPKVATRQIANRLEALGHQPFRSDKECYLVLLEDNPGKVIELGRTIRDSRLFPKSHLKRDIEMVGDLEAFAQTCKDEEWLVWNVGVTGAKAPVGNLVEAYKEFNRRINIEFTELRRLGFECILLTIHPRFDPVSGRFDLHAHFMCRMPEVHREAARRRLLCAFSKAAVPNDRVRNVAACATYMIWGICSHEALTRLPDDALSDLWRLSRSRARLVRTGQRFGRWKHSRLETADIDPGRTMRPDRRVDAASQCPQPECGDRILAKIKTTVGGKKIDALLYERRSGSESGITSTSMAPVDSSSATTRTTQDSKNATDTDLLELDDTHQEAPTVKPTEHSKGRPIGERMRNLVKSKIAVVSRAVRAFRAVLCYSVARRWLSRCRGSPR